MAPVAMIPGPIIAVRTMRGGGISVQWLGDKMR